MARTVLLAAIALLLSVPASAFAAQMEVHIASDDTEIAPSYKFLRVVNINYENGGVLSDLLAGKQAEISFSADSKTSDLGTLLEKINLNLNDVSSKVTVTDVVVHYKAMILSHEKSASIEYNIELIPTMKNFNLGRDPSTTFIDSQWRGIKIVGPVIIDTVEFGELDINNPESALQVMIPQVLDEIEKTDAIQILNIELLDASKILELPLYKWHFLFDPTAILEETKGSGYQGTVVSYYTMGECKIGIGSCEDRIWEKDFVIDEKYKISAIESQDDATISIEGYASYRDLGNIEIFGVTPNSPEIGRPATGGFPISVIYGMAGMAGIGAVTILIFSSRKLKKEEGMGQTGIDPSQLRAQETSSSGGGYHTNRGESHLIEKKSRSPI